MMMTWTVFRQLLLAILFFKVSTLAKGMQCPNSGAPVCTCSAPTFTISALSLIASGLPALSQLKKEVTQARIMNMIIALLGAYSVDRRVSSYRFPGKKYWKKRALLDAFSGAALAASLEYFNLFGDEDYESFEILDSIEMETNS